MGHRPCRLPFPHPSARRSPRQRSRRSAQLRRNHPTLLPIRVWKPRLATTPLPAAVLPSFQPPVALAPLPPSFRVPSGALAAVLSLLVLPLLAALLAALLPPSALAALLRLVLLPLLAALLPPSALAALLLLALLALPAALMTPLALAAFFPLALGLPLPPLLVPPVVLPLLLGLQPPLVSWLPLSVAALGPSPQRLSATHVCAEKEANRPKRPTCPSRFSECPSPMVPIPFAVAVAPPMVHIMPSLHLERHISTSKNFKCLWSVVQGFSLYQLNALQAKKGNEPAKASNLSPTVLRVPVPNGPKSFCSGCGAPRGTHNALTSS